MANDTDPADAEFQAGLAAQNAGRLEAAAAAYRRALDHDRAHAGALANLGTLARKQGRLEQAVALLSEAARIDGAGGDVWFNLANALEANGRAGDAVHALREAVRRAPGLARARLKLGLLLSEKGDGDAAIEALEAAARTLPADDPVFARGLGAPKAAILLFKADRYDAGIGMLNAIAAARPRDVAAQLNLAFALSQASHHEAALAAHRRALAIDAGTTDAIIGVAHSLANIGEPEQALAQYEAALADPRHRARAISAYLMATLYDADRSPEALAQTHRALACELAPRAPAPAVVRRRLAAGQLHVGYVTADLVRSHPVAQFIAPALRAHAAEGITQTVYLNTDRKDRTTATTLVQSDMVTTREVAGWDDARLADQIARDGIDLLIDLSGHTRGNRLSLFAQRPAPASATFIGYPHSTGLTQIDHLIADAIVCPPEADAYCAEKIERLPDAFLCFSPPDGMPEPSGAHPDGPPVFGALNHLPKLGHATLALWSDVLQAVPGARLLLKCGPFAEPSVRARLAARFAERGIAPERLILEGPETFTEAMRAYERIDIALDPIPYNGGTTTAHALWMGVPVVSLSGQTFCGRMGASLLSAAGAPELVAATPDEYVARCRALADDIAALRAGRRDRHAHVRASRLCDIDAYTHALLALYRRMARAA